MTSKWKTGYVDRIRPDEPPKPWVKDGAGFGGAKQEPPISARNQRRIAGKKSPWFKGARRRPKTDAVQIDELPKTGE
jgi:hypothetical protein